MLTTEWGNHPHWDACGPGSCRDKGRGGVDEEAWCLSWLGCDLFAPRSPQGIALPPGQAPGPHPALTGDAYTKTHFVQPGNSMCIWINGNLDTFVPGAMQVTPIQVQARRVCVDLDTDAVRGGGIDHCLQVQSIAISFKQDAPGGMSNDINVRVGDGPEHTLCLLLRREIELAMN